MYKGKEVELATHNQVIKKYSYAVPPEIYDQSIPQITTAKTIINEFIKEHSINGAETILDACCGTGLLSEYLGQFLSTGKVTGLDLAGNMIEYSRKFHASKNVSFEEEDITLLNPSRKKSADIITCSWAVSHIAMDHQKVMLTNLYHYLKEDGNLLVLFPVMGSILSTSIQSVVKSDEWNIYFKNFINNRVSFSSDEYNNLLAEAGFIQTNVKIQIENLSFKNRNELECFVTTALARYLPYLEEESLRIEFIKAVSNDYLFKTNSLEGNIPYSVTLLIASAKRPNLSCLLDPITDKEYLMKEQYNGTVNFQHRTKLFYYGVNIDLRQWEAEQYTESYNLNQSQYILEIGCGDGAFWNYIAPNINSNPEVILTDLSQSMLTSCSSNLDAIKVQFPIKFQQADMDNLLFKEGQFDCILIHNAIYHSTNPTNCIENIKKMLKPEGFLGLSVLNHHVNSAAWKIAHKINENVPNESFTAKFSDIEADQVLPLFFSRIEKRDYVNQLHFTQSTPLVNMIKSSPEVQRLNLPDLFFKTLKDKMEEKISEEREFVTEFNASLYLCRK